ncbi:2-dehydropantoate 2-reductase [Archaeoglobus profundus DSM 5631]|uniref:2-dehydropantoate 2-reductase n=2 Tax=Archaeoglobus profundus TaxID=84156 RepID=D2RFV5_ARCPA|nr:2-dehydropantoate 2-reductase [Archaeoglobus profundus DSM 5631]
MGAGALGCLYGYLLQRKFEVVFVARGKQFEALKRGLKVTGLVEDFVRVNAVDRPCDADITFVTVKSYDTEEVAKSLRNVDCGIVVSLQNGIGNEEILSTYLGRVLGGVTTYASNLIDYGWIEFAGVGETFIGSMDGKICEDVLVVVEVLRECGINAEAVSDIVRRKWIKTVINSVINPITAILRVRNGAIVEIEELWKLASAVLREGEEVLKAMGFDVELEEVLKDVVTKTARNRSSMLQDIERGKRTEIDFINGAIVRKAEELGIDTPYNRALLLLVKSLEKFLTKCRS